MAARAATLIPAAAACLRRPPAASSSPRAVTVVGADTVWLVPEATPAVAGASAWSRDEAGGSSVVASVAAGGVPPSGEAGTPTGRPLEDSSVVYWMP